MKNLLFLLSILIFVACENNDDDISIFQPADLNFSTLGQGHLSNINGMPPSNLVITNESEWNQLLFQMNSIDNNITDGFNSTVIDFNNDNVIAVILEVKNSFWIVEIADVIEYEDTIEVSIQETATIGGAVTQPFHIVKIPKTNKLVIFE